MRAELKVVEGKHQGAVIPINRKKFLVGREEDCHLRPNSDLVSRHHCVFTIDDYSVRLRDLGSTNGTLVNDARLNGQIELKDGDTVRIGKLLFQMVIRVSVPSAAVAAASSSVSQSSVSQSQMPIESSTLHSLNPITSQTAEFALSESGMLKISNAEAGHQTGVFGGDTTLIPPPDVNKPGEQQRNSPISVPTPLPPTVSTTQPVAASQPLAAVPPPSQNVPPPPREPAVAGTPSAADLIRQYMQKRTQ